MHTIDWTPLVAAMALFFTALAASLPSFVVVLQHRATRQAIEQNSATLGKIEQATNGNLSDMQAAVRSLRAEVVRLNALVDAAKRPDDLRERRKLPP